MFAAEVEAVTAGMVEREGEKEGGRADGGRRGINEIFFSAGGEGRR
jgi:hypothetical protein